MAIKGRNINPQTNFKKGNFYPSSYNTGGAIPWNKNLKGYRAGKKSHLWKGGITSLRQQIRHLLESKQWIRKIFIRDKYTCQKCGIRSGCGKKVVLEAHHIKSFAKILEDFLSKYNQFSLIEDKETLVRLAITYEPFWNIKNGKTLCVQCHIEERNS